MKDVNEQLPIFRENLSYWLKGDANDIVFCLDMIKAIHLWDDLIDKDKNLYTMYSSKNYLEENNNNTEINISAIVKAHKTFNHVNYTHIKCPKIIK